MTTKVHLYSNLRSFADDQGIVEVNGDTVGACLGDLVKRFPKLGTKVFDKFGKLSPQIFVSVNMNSTNPERVERTLKEGDEIYLVLIVSGGSYIFVPIQSCS